MVASVAQEEDLGLEEVLDILDEATQVRAYSRELEAKSQELEAATTELRAGNERLRELDQHEGRLHFDRDARTAHTADLDSRAFGNAA
jgi:DNA repair ATPase RecN